MTGFKNFLGAIVVLFTCVFLHAAPAQAVALTSGTVKNGSLPLNGADTYTFTGTAGQGVMLYANAAYWVIITVKDPGGTVLGAPANRYSLTLPSTGTYTVVITALHPTTESGAYTLNYLRGSDSVSSGSLNSGQSVTGSIGANNITSYQFTATAGQFMAIFVDTSYGAASNTIITVYNPDGSYWDYSYDRETPFSPTWALPNTGTYTVAVTGFNRTDSGTFRLDYAIGGGATSNGPLMSGFSETGTLARNSLLSFTFEGTSGQVALFYGHGTGYTTYFTVMKPDGSYLGTPVTTAERYAPALPVTTPTTGTYTVFLYGYNKTDTGDYRLDFLRASDTVSKGSLFNGLAHPDSLLLNGLDSYTISGTAGSTLAVTTSAGYGTTVVLYNPDGSQLALHNTSVSATMPTSGEYTVVVVAQNKAASGAYTVTATVTSPNVPATTPSKTGTPCPACEAARANMANNPAGTDGVAVNAPPFLNPNINGPLPYVNLPLSGNSGQSSGFVGAESGDISNAMNFDLGFKQQIETDYNTAGLPFVRYYRSDSTWTNNTVGTYWRHNYARTLTVPGSTASITDGSGATRTYTASGGNWVADDPSNMNKLETITGGYKYTLHDGTVEKYDTNKLLTRIEFLGGGALNLGYNGSSQLTSVTNENGRQLTMTYSSGKLATLVTPDGTYTYGYTGSNLTTVTRPDTKVTTYHYEDGTYTNALTGITDEKGNRWATFAYGGGSGKVSSVTLTGSADGYSVSYATNTTTVTNPLGKSFTYRYKNYQGVRRVAEIDGAASTNTPASSRYFNYDTLGRLISSTDWDNNFTRYQYDSRSNVTKIVEGYASVDARTTTISYIGTFNLPDVVTEPGKTTDYDYDTYGRLTSVTVTDTATAATRIWAYTYYSNGTDGSGNVILGRLQQIDGPRTDVGDTTDFAYDGNLNLSTITNALSQVTTITSRDSAGRPTDVTDANSIVTHITYDSNGWLDTATGAYGTGLAAVTDFDYDFNGNLTKVTLPNSVYVQYSYDNAQRLTGITDALGNTITYTLNNAGNATAVVAKNTTPTTTYSHTATFDELARMLTSVGAASQTAHFAWDVNSNLGTYTDPRTNATGYAYDALQRLSTATNALSGVATLGYTGLGDVNSVKDQRNHTTSYTYNAFGDVTGETSPDRGTLSYTVDKAGNVTQRTDGNSVVTNFTYDALNRPLTVAYPADSSLNATLTYDSSSGCGTPYRGHLCSVSDAAGSTTYQYDSLGRVTSAADVRGANTFTTSYTYDLAGNIATITLPSGRVVTYTRNGNGQVSAVSAPVNGSSVSLASSVTYLPFGPLKGLTYGNTLTLSATFDTDYYPTNRTISGGIANWTYTTNANGDVTQAGATTYGYDVLNRVNAENAGAATSYTYDATSNRLTKVQGGTTSTTVPSTSNKISAVGGTSYTYDSAGNITAIGTNGYVWSAAGLMKEYKISGTSTATYLYNAYNQRAKKVTGGTTTYYVYGAGGLLYGEYTSAGALVREYVYLNGAPLAQVTTGSPETVAYLHTDHLGTPRYATNSAGSSVWAWNNDAFGVSSPSGSVTVNLRMAGQYYDSESSLFYNWNRYYNPAIGRYISSDPMGVTGGLNTFSYVEQNSVMLIDPLGFGFRYGQGPLQWLPNVERAAEVGTWSHQQFFSYINQKFPKYKTNRVLDALLDPTRPDVVGDGQVWELKSSSCQEGAKRNAAEAQLQGYADRGNFQIGNSRALVGTGVDIEVDIAGQPFTFHFFPDADPTSGLIYYDLVDTQGVLRPLWKALKNPGAIPGLPPGVIPVMP